jgi:hypothetical protein
MTNLDPRSIIEPKLTLAITWNPRGELIRFERSLLLIKEIYASIAISFPPVADPKVTDLFFFGVFASDPSIYAVKNQEWSWGRYMAIKTALNTPSDYIQYADLDRLLRWIETYPDEWRETANAVRKFDCLIIGRTENAYKTHPRALRETETISNKVASFFLGSEMDVSAGSKGFCRRAAQYIVDHCSPGHALGTDSEWPIVLHRAGFEIKYLAVEGLTWESADRYQDYAVDHQEQLQAAIAYDRNPNSWSNRVGVAEEIVRSAIEASTRKLD